jgi:hypothetical protein
MPGRLIGRLSISVYADFDANTLPMMSAPLRDHRTQLVPVDRLGRRRGGVTVV